MSPVCLALVCCVSWLSNGNCVGCGETHACVCARACASALAAPSSSTWRLLGPVLYQLFIVLSACSDNVERGWRWFNKTFVFFSLFDLHRECCHRLIPTIDVVRPPYVPVSPFYATVVCFEELGFFLVAHHFCCSGVEGELTSLPEHLQRSSTARLLCKYQWRQFWRTSDSCNVQEHNTGKRIPTCNKVCLFLLVNWRRVLVLSLHPPCFIAQPDSPPFNEDDQIFTIC